MKRLWICIFLFCFPWHAAAQSETADEQANCNASFQGGCPTDGTITTSSDGFAAPLGALGNSGLEGVLIVLLIAGGIGRRLAKGNSTPGDTLGVHRSTPPGGR